MALATEAARRFTSKLNTMLDKVVTVRLTTGRTYKGRLTGFDLNSLSLLLEGAEDSDGNKWPAVIIYGSGVSEILLEEEAVFVAREFAEYLARNGGIGWHLMKVYDDLNILEVAKNVRVTSDGVEGSGPLAQKIYTLYREYLRSKGVRE
ncbi:MAG: Lsm family RNA-binding protein [Desulfurococcales archaeon]|nr:Lsm family RNA-binding protein [Desulfurococcales archaeon]